MWRSTSRDSIRRALALLGKVQQDDGGFTVVLPRQAYRVERGAARPVGDSRHVAREATQNVSETRAPNRFWVLLSASGTFGDDMPTIGFIGLGLALLLAAIYTGVQASMPGASPVSRDDEKWLSLGIAAILALLLTRVIIGARVAFFAPFLRRSIETAVGMWVAIAIVAVGLLSWSAWVPALLTSARNALAGQIALRRLLELRSRADQFVEDGDISSARVPAVLTLLALLSLGRATPAAVANGVVAGVVVLLAWICLAWVAAFAGHYFETFDRGAWSVVEQLSPTNRLSASSDIARNTVGARRLDAWNTRVPELPMIIACFAAELALLPSLTAALAIMSLTVIVATPFVIRRRRSAGAMPSLPDYWGALVGAAVFTLAIAGCDFRARMARWRRS